MCERTLQYFLKQRRIDRMDAAEVCWSHAVNSRSRLTEALTGPSHMIEADIIMSKEPIMAHPPDTDSDVTLKEWLEAVKEHNKGIKLDFKRWEPAFIPPETVVVCNAVFWFSCSLEAVSQSLALLGELLAEQSCPVWINADILCGPGGQATPLDSQAFLSAVTALPTHTVLSLGWTTGWTAAIDNPGYSWDMVRTMEEKCRSLTHPVTFPVRAALLAQSFSQLSWLLQQSDSSHAYRLEHSLWLQP
ncbi:protein FAM151B isoform 3-T3 [Odontesthes bonariensis]